MNISILGCGRWGSFIAWYLNKTGHDITLWGRPGSCHINEIKVSHRNEFIEFDEKIFLTEDLNEALRRSDTIVISINAQALRGLAQNIKACADNLEQKIFVLCMKGIEEKTGERLSQVIKQCLGEDTTVAVWVGPGHVQDFIAGIPNCMVIDCENESTKRFLVDEFSSPLIRFYYGRDMIGSEIGAAAKNVMGIAAGILDGMNYGSLKGALMSRGTREISRLISALGGNALSAYGLAHLGDYQATLFSPHSNNRRFGECLVTNIPYDKLAEGVATSHALVELGKFHAVELPICMAVNDSVQGKVLAKDAIENLFLRSIKHEF